MKIAIIGYGKMGKVIEEVALSRNHEVILRIDQDNIEQLTDGSLKEVDVAIEFSRPEAATTHIKACINQQVAVVVGTTGWYESWDEISDLCKEKDGALLAATNFSIGVNIFFELNRKLTRLMRSWSEYTPKIEEIHHTEKLDSPSGTAITLAEGLISENPQIQQWVNEESKAADSLSIISHREPEVPGTHTVSYDSEIDSISITHQAKNRKGFALGAVLAAEYIKGKTGVFSMNDLLNF